MRQKKFWFALIGILAVLAVALMLPTGAGAVSKYKILHKFKGGRDGANPDANLTLDSAGNLYGTTVYGGGLGNCDFSCGTVFKLTPNSDGTWTESVLYRFGGGADGAVPWAGLIFDAAGNLYGVTERGGDYGCGSGNGCGTVFKLTPQSDGHWTHRVLHSFKGGADGAFLYYAGLTFDAAGNLFGVTQSGGNYNCGFPYGCGVIFELKPNSNGSWTESVLYRFCSLRNCADGTQPYAGLIFDGAGSLYGTTSLGGDLKCDNSGIGCGTVFKLTPQSDGSWTQSVLHVFQMKPGGYPLGGLVFDNAGNLYGTTVRGGPAGGGAVFKLTPNSDGSWAYSVLHVFQGKADLGPDGGVVFDNTRNLYGTTVLGGPADGGAVFKLTPNSDGSWTHSLLHIFQGKPALNPHAGVIFDKAGTLYGTTEACGDGYNCQGVVFEITP